MKKLIVIAIILLLLIVVLVKINNPISNISNMKITSPAFASNGQIPAKHTCDGKNVNPPLRISGVPAGAKSLALVVDDPDAPRGNWVHWTIWNLDPALTEIPEASAPPGIEGATSFDKPGYGGPCPSSGTHRYFFKLYALNALMALPPAADKTALEKAMKDHILATAELVGLYSRE